MCAVAVLAADAAMCGILLWLCLLLQYDFAVRSDSLLLYALMPVQYSDVCSLEPLKLASQHIRHTAEQVVSGNSRQADMGT